MKTTELIRMIRRALAARDGLPHTDAELRLDAGLHLAVMACEDEIRLGHPPMERRCLICEQPVGQCYC